MIESIFSSIVTKDDVCLYDIHKVKLPDKICPFGCKKEVCPLGWDNVGKCPHDLDAKDLPELSEYLIKVFYHDTEDGEGGEKRHSEQIAPEKLKAFMEHRRPGSYGRNRSNNNKV